MINDDIGINKHIVAPSLKEWGLTTTTKLFTVRYRDILIFDTDGKIVDCLMNEQNKPYEILLACNNYIVEQDD